MKESGCAAQVVAVWRNQAVAAAYLLMTGLRGIAPHHHTPSLN